MSALGYLVVALSLLALVGGLSWSRVGRTRTRRDLQRALEHPESAVRVAALEVLGSQGIGTFAEFLVGRAAVEHDDAVLRVLASVVARNQWEPVRSPAMADLRLWAQRYFAEGEPEPGTAPGTEPGAQPGAAAVTPPPVAPPSGPPIWAQPAVTGSQAPAAQVPYPEEVRREAEADSLVGAFVPYNFAVAYPGAVEPLAATVPGPPSPSAPLPLVVVGVGGPAGVGIVQALQVAGHRVLATDPDPFAAALRIAAESIVTPHPSHPSFVGILCQLVDTMPAAAVVCVDAETLRVLAVTGGPLTRRGACTWFPEPHAAAVTRDRATAARIMAAVGVPSDFGAAGLLGGAGDLDPGIVAAGGRAFAVDALVDRSGVLVGAVSSWRPVGRDGLPVVGATFHEPSIPNLVSAALAAVGLRGPATVTGRVDPGGSVVLTGIDPGYSSAFPLAVAAGADLAGQYLQGLIGWPVRPDLLTYHDDVSMLPGTERTLGRGATPAAGADDLGIGGGGSGEASGS